MSQQVSIPTTKDLDPKLAALPDFFLFNPKNHAFVEGTSHSIATAPKVFVLLTVLVVATSLILIFANLRSTEWNDFIQQERNVASGSVVGRFAITTNNADGGTDHSYIISYRFSLPGVEKYFQTGSQEVDEDTFNRIPDGSVLSITYLPANPYTSWITGHDLYTDPVPSLSILSLSVCVVTLLALGWTIRYAWRKRRLARKGRLIRGQVAGWHFEEQINEGVMVMIVMSCQFETPSGRKIVTRTIREDNFHHPKIGTPIAILYVNDQFYEML